MNTDEVKESVKQKEKKPFYKKVWFWLVVVVIVAVASSGGSEEKDTFSNKEQVAEGKKEDTLQASSDEVNEEESEIETEEEIVYTSYTVAQMQADLEVNALKAESLYNNQYVEITGSLGTIDSSGKYISLLPLDDEWAIMGVQCYITNDEQKAQVMEMTAGDVVTLRGKVTAVGEIMGYSLDIDSIN